MKSLETQYKEGIRFRVVYEEHIYKIQELKIMYLPLPYHMWSYIDMRFNGKKDAVSKCKDLKKNYKEDIFEVFKT